ncbi:MAG: peroxiredoxin family protein [Mycobacteriales bacterium]|jgi:peroxiredoxin
MSAETDQHLSLDLTVLDTSGTPVTLAALLGGAKALALYFMRTPTCPMCLRHVRALARLDLPALGVRPVVVVPGTPAQAARAGRGLDDRVAVVASADAQAHRAVGLTRTLFLQHSGVLLVDAAGIVRYRLAAALPTAGFDAAALRAAIDGW